MSNRQAIKKRKVRGIAQIPLEFHRKTPPRKFDLTDPDGPDARILDAIAVGKTYRAAGAGHSTVGQVGYRLAELRKGGMAVSPRIWREAALTADVRKLRDTDRRFRYMNLVLNDARRTLSKIRAEKARRKKGK